MKSIPGGGHSFVYSRDSKAVRLVTVTERRGLSRSLQKEGSGCTGPLERLKVSLGFDWKYSRKSLKALIQEVM